MKSMTGYGAGSAELGAGQVTLEIRALNHKHQDLRLRIPHELSEQQFFLEALARKHLGRGRFDLSVRTTGTIGHEPVLSAERARARYRLLLELRDELAPNEEVPLSALFQFEDLFEQPSISSESSQEALSRAFNGALLELDKMRNAEGERLRADFETRIVLVQGLIEEISAQIPRCIAHLRDKMRARLVELLENTKLAPERLEVEIAILADRADVTEELVRLRSHLVALAELVQEKLAVGRKIDFLLQEVGREVNTIGSKSHDAVIAQLVVQLKAEVERMREQVQNIE